MRMMLMAVTVQAALAAMPVMAQETADKRPVCSRKVKDSCQQTAAQERLALTAAQAAARDARFNGEWSPNHDRPQRAPRR